jgi:RNA polymerase sigma-70 factor (ECF subfamily)
VEGRPLRLRLEEIYREHRQGLFTLALSITRSVEQAEDAVQEAFARLWRSDPSPQGDSVAYAFASVRNVAIEVARRRTDRPAGDSLFETAAPASRDGRIEEDACQRVRAAIDRLPLRQRQAVVLRLYAGLTFRQIAEVLGEPLPTVASRYRRALERLRDRLQGLM